MIVAPRSQRIVSWYYNARPASAGRTSGLAWRLLWRRVRQPQAAYDPARRCWTFPLVLDEQSRVLLAGGLVGIVQLVTVDGEWTLAFQPISEQPS